MVFDQKPTKNDRTRILMLWGLLTLKVVCFSPVGGLYDASTAYVKNCNYIMLERNTKIISVHGVATLKNSKLIINFLVVFVSSGVFITVLGCKKMKKGESL